MPVLHDRQLQEFVEVPEVFQIHDAFLQLLTLILVSGAFGPTLPSNWRVVGAADFNDDGKPDYLLFNATTRQSVIWYLNNNLLVSGAYGPTVAVGYTLTGTADFNRDGKPDYALLNASTRRTAIWYLDDNVYVSGAYGPTLPAGWSLAAP